MYCKRWAVAPYNLTCEVWNQCWSSWRQSSLALNWYGPDVAQYLEKYEELETQFLAVRNIDDLWTFNKNYDLCEICCRTWCFSKNNPSLLTYADVTNIKQTIESQKIKNCYGAHYLSLWQPVVPPTRDNKGSTQMILSFQLFETMKYNGAIKYIKKVKNKSEYHFVKIVLLMCAFLCMQYIDGLVQKRCDLHLSCTNPTICFTIAHL